MPLSRQLIACLGAIVVAIAVQPVAAVDARQAHAVRLTEQARALDRGVGVPMDLELAATLYCEAARSGYAPAQYHLGWMFANGRGVDRDKAAAAALFRAAADQGHPQASNMLSLVASTPPRQPDCLTDELAASGLLSNPERRRIAKLVQTLAPRYGVRPLLALAIIKAESNFDARAVSPKNAQGLMQLIPETAARFRVSDSFDPEQNIRGGLAYLRWLLAYYQGRVELVVAAYNAGEKAVDRHGGIPPYAETQAYVQRVMRIAKHGKHPYDPAVVAPSSVAQATGAAIRDGDA